MAVELVTWIHTYHGLSTDDKPASIPVGSTFLETDTGYLWLYTANRGWEIPGPIFTRTLSVSDGESEIIGLLRLISFQLGLITGVQELEPEEIT